MNIVFQNGTKYCVVLDIDMWHGRKIIRVLSPLHVSACALISVLMSAIKCVCSVWRGIFVCVCFLMCFLCVRGGGREGGG